MLFKGCLWDLAVFWKSYIFLLLPVVLLPLIFVYDTPEAKCGYGLLIMAVYWLTETIPLAVTALLPCVLFPMLGVLGLKEIVSSYIKDTNMLLLGGLMVALSVERSGLHRRIALRLLMVMGTKPQWLMLGFMLPTWFLSMWISNTATTAMMIPVAQAVLTQLETNQRRRNSSSQQDATENVPNIDDCSFDVVVLEEKEMYTVSGKQGTFELEQIPSDETVTENSKQTSSTAYAVSDTDNKPSRNVSSSHASFSKGLCLSIAYAANVGGTATLTGTPPNLVLKNLVDDLYEDKGLDTPITFATWMVWGVPGAVLCLILVWLWMQILFLGPRQTFHCCSRTSGQEVEGVKEIIHEEYRKLGSIRFAEVANLVYFVLLVLLWLTRNPGFVDGWGSLFTPGFVTDSVPSIFVAVLLFASPSTIPQMICCRRNSSKPKRSPPLLDWDTASTRMAWGPILILGGGFALADASGKSGLSQLIADQLEVLRSLPDWVIVLLVATLIAAATEVTSNTATTNLFLPILQTLAINLNFHPLYLMLPATIAASYAFMLPVATPPNAIVFSYGHIKVLDMAKSGLILNIICVLVVVAGTHTWGWAYFNLGDSPFVDPSNITTLTP